MTVPARDTSASQNYTYRYITVPDREYEINFKFLADDENITAFLRLTDGTRFDLKEGTHYEVKILSGNNNIWGSLKFKEGLDLPPEGEVDWLCIFRGIPNDQNKTYDSQTIFSNITEYCLDKLTMLIQDYVQSSKFLRAPVDAQSDPDALELPAMNTWTNEKVLGFDEKKKIALFDYSNPVSNRGLRQPNEETPDPSFVISVEKRASKVVGFDEKGQVKMLDLDKVPTPSDAAPPADGTAAPGTDAKYSRGDHVHPITPDATQSAHGLMSAADKTKLDGIEGVPVPSDAAPPADGTAAPGTDAKYSRGDHVHPITPDATQSAHGLMSAADKTKLDDIDPAIPTQTGTNNGVNVSYDLQWTQRTSGVSAILYGICYANGLFVAVGGSGTIVTSPDDITWTQRTSGVADKRRFRLFTGNCLRERFICSRGRRRNDSYDSRRYHMDATDKRRYRHFTWNCICKRSVHSRGTWRNDSYESGRHHVDAADKRRYNRFTWNCLCKRSVRSCGSK
jgi:hypothetical protein